MPNASPEEVPIVHESVGAGAVSPRGARGPRIWVGNLAERNCDAQNPVVVIGRNVAPIDIGRDAELLGECAVSK